MTKERVFREYKGKSGRTWLVGVEDQQNNIYVSANPRENEPGYKGARGFDGRQLKFKMEEDDCFHLLTGPWHSSPEAFTEDVGVEL